MYRRETGNETRIKHVKSIVINGLLAVVHRQWDTTSASGLVLINGNRATRCEDQLQNREIESDGTLVVLLSAQDGENRPLVLSPRSKQNTSKALFRSMPGQLKITGFVCASRSQCPNLSVISLRPTPDLHGRCNCSTTPHALFRPSTAGGPVGCSADTLRPRRYRQPPFSYRRTNRAPCH